MNFHDPGSGLKPRNSGLKGSHIYAQPFLTSNGTWPTSLPPESTNKRIVSDNSPKIKVACERKIKTYEIWTNMNE